MTKWHLSPEHESITQVSPEPTGYIYVKRFIVSSWLQLWRLRCPKVCSQKAGHAGIADVSVLVQRQGKTLVPAQSVRQEEFPLIPGVVKHFVLFRPSPA